MYKAIPGSLTYRIDLKGVIVDPAGQPVDLRTSKGRVELELFGRKMDVCHSWLRFLAWYECGHITNLKDHLDDIDFIEVDNTYLRIKCRRMMVFKNPIYYMEGFRYIPNFPRYAIDREGSVLDTTTNTFIDEVFSDPSGYLTHYIRNPDKNGNRHTRIHRLKALAWIENDRPGMKTLINHKNGIKSDNELDNLEWVTHAQNVRHALTTGLTKTRIKMKARDVVTGDIQVFDSVSEMAEALGASLGVSVDGYSNKLPGYLWKKRYEIKPYDDETPWYYEDTCPSEIKPSKAIYTITVTEPNLRRPRVFNSIRHFKTHYGLSVKSDNVELLLGTFKKSFPECKVDCTRNALKGPYELMDLETGEIKKVGTIAELSDVIGRSRAMIQGDLSKGLKYIYEQKWLIGCNGEEIIADDYIHRPVKRNKVLVEDLNKGVEYVCSSGKEAARKTGLNEKTVYKNIDQEIVFKGFKFRALGR